MMPAMDYATIDLVNEAIVAGSSRSRIEQVVSQGDTLSNVWTFRTPDNNVLFLDYNPESDEVTIYRDERRSSDLDDRRTELKIQKLDNGAITVERVLGQEGEFPNDSIRAMFGDAYGGHYRVSDFLYIKDTKYWIDRIIMRERINQPPLPLNRTGARVFEHPAVLNSARDLYRNVRNLHNKEYRQPGSKGHRHR